MKKLYENKNTPIFPDWIEIEIIIIKVDSKQQQKCYANGLNKNTKIRKLITFNLKTRARFIPSILLFSSFELLACFFSNFNKSSLGKLSSLLGVLGTFESA